MEFRLVINEGLTEYGAEEMHIYASCILLSMIFLSETNLKELYYINVKLT